VLVGRTAPVALRLALAGLVVLSSNAAAQISLPAGFQDTVVFSGLTKPTAVAFASDGRVFVAEKSGLIKVFASLTATTPTVFADLRTNVYNYWDRGLLGLALHPNFPATPYVYVLYTYDAPIGGTAPTWGTPGATTDTCPDPPGATQGCVASGRLSRLEALGNAMTGAEQVLINDWFEQYPSHSVGTLLFGNDGALYASAGEGASFDFADYGQKGIPPNPGGDPPEPVGGTQTPPTAEGGALRAQDLRTTGDPVTLDGAVLRLDPSTGAAMADNPLAGSADSNARRIIAYGLRNPFRMTARPGTSEIWIGDVGYNTWEEINRIASTGDAVVENFGWPCYEGVAKQPAYEAANLNLCQNLYATPSAVTPPYFTYQHLQDVVPGETCANGSSSISALAFYSGATYPAPFSGALFFGDYSRDCMWVMKKGSNGQPDPTTITTFAAGVPNPVDLKAGPGGDLFYVDLLGGMIHRIQYTGANQSPTAVIQATPTFGPAPLQVHFDASGSSDPNLGDTLSYSWDLDGNGAYGDSISPTPTFTYTIAKNYTVRLRVTDSSNASATASVVITAGDSPPTATILSPAPTLTWKVGDVVSFSGSATDAKDGTLPPSALSWSLLLHHCPSSCHIHPIQDFPGVASGSFPAPDHEYPSHLELILTATDSSGLTDTKSVLLQPKTVALGFQSNPPGLQLVAGSDSKATPFTKTVIAGSINTVSAPSSQTMSLTHYEFGSWSDGGAQTHTLTAPAAPATYTATYGEALPDPWLDQDVGAVGIAGTATQVAGTFTLQGSGADIQSVADAFHFAYRPLSGDGQIVARVVSQVNTNMWAKAGVMIRQMLTAGSPYAFVAMTPSRGATFQSRLTSGGATTAVAGPAVAAPYWVKLVRSGTTLTGSISPDGVVWTTVGSAAIAMGSDVFIGLAVTSHVNTKLSAAGFDNVVVNTSPSVAITSPTSVSDFSAPATIEITASASDAEGSVAQVEFLSGNALLGSDTTSPYAFTWSSVAAGTYSLAARATDNQGAARTSAPVVVTVGASALSAPWLDQDVGAVGVGGTASQAGGTFTVKGSGADIQGSADAFHFAYRTLSGDGQIVARVASQGNTNAWAKAGIMIRQSLTAGSPYAFMAVTPSHGTTFQNRLAAGGATAVVAGASVAVPYWVRIVRSGTSLVGSTSPDGVTWTPVASATIAMGSDVFVGLAVSSHANLKLSAATFDNVGN
jgi:glucose/arabinose dehydrogenase/regulation of enolase protein 1 (concanavalin A-like superfamily)